MVAPDLVLQHSCITSVFGASLTHFLLIWRLRLLLQRSTLADVNDQANDFLASIKQPSASESMYLQAFSWCALHWTPSEAFQFRYALWTAGTGIMCSFWGCC